MDYKSFTFNGGEEHVILKGVDWGLPIVSFTHEIKDSGDLECGGACHQTDIQRPRFNTIPMGVT